MKTKLLEPEDLKAGMLLRNKSFNVGLRWWMFLLSVGEHSAGIVMVDAIQYEILLRRKAINTVRAFPLALEYWEVVKR